MRRRAQGLQDLREIEHKQVARKSAMQAIIRLEMPPPPSYLGTGRASGLY